MPVTFLGQIPVIVIMHKKLDHGQHESRISGIVFSISSIAGILAVLISACIMIPLLGINYTLLLLILIFIGFQWYFTKTINKRINIWILTCLCIISAIILIGREKKIHTSFNKNELIKISEVQNGILGQLKVVVNKSTNTKYLYVNNSLQSKTHLTGRSLYPYLYSLVTYASFKPANSDVLIAGMGAGSLVYEFSMLNFNVDVVDIDERLQGISERNFLLPSKEFHFIKSDIRRFIKKSSKKYDVIVLDLSKGEAVPTNVYTYESFLECQKLLKENGIILIHFLSSLSEDGQLALASIKRTLKQTGFECEIMNRKNQKHLLDGVSDLTIPDGYILLSAKKIDLSNAEFIIDPSLIKELIPQKENLFLEFDESRGLLLTDDKPILDILEMQNTIYMRKQNIKALIQINKYAK
jgi:predicted membrane-bound spermidine synthase